MHISKPEPSGFPTPDRCALRSTVFDGVDAIGGVVNRRRRIVWADPACQEALGYVIEEER